jgi:hypothetical protein
MQHIITAATRISMPLLVAVLATASCGAGTSATPEAIQQQTAAITSVGWQHIGPTGGAKTPGQNRWNTGVTTDVEGINGRYRISTLGDGVFEWNGSSWISLMTRTSACPFCNVTIPASDTPMLDCEGLSVQTFSTKPGDVNTIIAGTASDPHDGNSAASGIWRGVWNGSISAWQWTQVATAGAVGSVYKIRWGILPTEVHAATSTGYWYSTDSGVTWSNALAGVFYDLTRSPLSQTSMYAASTTGLIKVGFDIDSGQALTAQTIVSLAAGPSAVAWSPADRAGSVVYYMPSNGTQIINLYRVVNDSASVVPNFMPAATGGGCGWTWALAVNPNNPSQILAGCASLEDSQDGGRTWNNPSPPGGTMHGDLHALAFDTSGNALGVSDGGYFYSTDGGQNWNSDSNFSDMVGLTDFDVSNGGQAFLGTAWDTNNFASTNSGASWTSDLNAPNVGDVGDQIQALADPGLNGRFWQRDRGGNCLRTPDYGSSYVNCNSGVGPFSGMAHDSAPPVYLYAANGTQVYRSIDFGDSWRPLGPTLPASGVVTAGQYVAGAQGSCLYVLTGGTGVTGVYLNTSLNSGNWTPSSVPLVAGSRIQAIVAPPGLPQTAYALGVGPAQVFVTTNCGANWSPITGDLPQNGPNFGLRDIVVDSTNTNVLFLASTAGVYKSTNGGTHWAKWVTQYANGTNQAFDLPGGGSQDVYRLRVLDQRASGGSFNVYAGIWGSGIWMRNGAEN